MDEALRREKPSGQSFKVVEAAIDEILSLLELLVLAGDFESQAKFLEVVDIVVTDGLFFAV